MLFDCFETRSPSKKDVIQQHLVALGISVLVNWIIWLAMGIGYYSCLESGLLARAIAVDLVEVAIETAVVIELAIMLCKAVSRIYSRRQPRFRIILEQVLISYALISIVCVCIGIMYKELEPDYPDVFWRTFISDSLVVSMFVLVFFTSSLTNKYRDRQEEVLRLKLDVLSIQSDNHFIFNSLGALYGLIGNDDAAAASFLDKLTGIFRYISSVAGKHYVPLKDEIRFTEDYINLIAVRYEGISFNISDSVRDTDAYVCPVAIQSLVENAIRHNKHGKNAPLEICLYCENDYIIVDNTYAPIDIPSLKTGNQNLSRRYKILAGKEIQALQENGIYRVKIPLLTYKDIKNEDSDN